MKKTFLLILALIASITLTINAQGYNTAIGLRAGSASGITLKHSIGGNRALEGIVDFNFQNNGMHFTGLYEIHKEAFSVNGLNWYYGLGFHVGFWDSPDHNHSSTSSLGIDGILGLEYVIKEIPFTIGLDWKPALDIYQDVYGNFGLFGLSVRYYFN